MNTQQELIQDFIESILNNPYPEDVFLPISKDELKAIHEMLIKEFNMPIDRLTGHIGRSLRKPLQDEANKIAQLEQSPVSVIEDSKADFYEYGQSLEIKINDLQRLRSRFTITKKSQSTPIEVKP